MIAALRAGADGPFDPKRIRGTIESALDEGDVVLMAAFGSGLTWGASVVRW